MIYLLERLGPVRELDRREGAVQLAIELPPAEHGAGPQMMEALRAAAAGVAEFVAKRTGAARRVAGAR